jgi:hypothetical protein
MNDSVTPAWKDLVLKRSSTRILTTHVGSLVRPPEILQPIIDKAQGKPVDEAKFAELALLASD